ncbi:MAG: hypothetical protein WBP26_01940 [Candidatus Saccharimonadales bacterium]
MPRGVPAQQPRPAGEIVGLPPISLYHDVGFGDLRFRPPNSRELVSLTGVLASVVSPPDERDPWGEDDRPVSLAEVLPDTKERRGTDRIDFELLVERLHAAIEKLPADEAGLIMKRFGLAGGESWTRVRIGNERGRSDTRIRDIETLVLHKLRGLMGLRNPEDFRGIASPEPSGDARVFCDWMPNLSRAAYVVGTDYAQQSPDRQEEDPADIVRQRRKAEAAAARGVNDVRLKQLTELLCSAECMDFSKSFGETANSDYPVLLLHELNILRGAGELSPRQIETLWDEFLAHKYPDLQERLVDDLATARIGRLFSRIIAENIHTNEGTVHLKIPDELGGKIDCIATNLSIGRVCVWGDAGDYVGAWNKGSANVEVVGNAGDCAGALMSGQSKLFISFWAGYGLGMGAREGANIQAHWSKSVGLYDQTTVYLRRRGSQ